MEMSTDTEPEVKLPVDGADAPPAVVDYSHPVVVLENPRNPSLMDPSKKFQNAAKTFWARRVRQVLSFKGNGTEEDDAFRHDLVLNCGESVLGEFKVWLSNPRKFRFSAHYSSLLITIVVFIINWIIGLIVLAYFAFNFFRRLFGERARMVLTDKGRILVWKSQFGGMQKFLCLPLSVSSQTVFMEFNVKNLCYFERFYSRQKGCWGLLSTERVSSLHLFFNEFPSLTTSLARAHVGGSANVKEMGSEIFAAVSDVSGFSDCFTSVFKWLFKLMKAAFNEASSLAGLFGTYSNVNYDHMLFIESAEEEFYKSETTRYDWDSLLSLDQKITELRLKRSEADFDIAEKELPLSEDEKDVADYTWEEGDCEDEANRLIAPRAGHSVVYKQDFGIGPNEKILATCPLSYGVTFTDLVLTVLSLGLWYLICVQKLETLKTTIILTSKRLLVVQIESGKGEFKPDDIKAEDFNFKVLSWFFNKVEAGMIGNFEDRVTGRFLTDYGILSFTLSEPSFWNCSSSLSRSSKTRFTRFLSKIMRICNGRKVLEGDPISLEGSQIVKRYFPSPSESPLALLKSSNRDTSLTRFIEKITCGIYPVRCDGELLISSERVWLSLVEVSKRTCMLREPSEYLICVPLEMIDGGRVVGNASFCSPSWCLDPVHASVMMELPLKDAGYPVFLWRTVDIANSGLMEDEVAVKFRKLLASVTFANQCEDVVTIRADGSAGDAGKFEDGLPEYIEADIHITA
eukprot:TRINITY_DN1721_c0_g1_i1.p1 TRINITY_DN1721_c0_g1~~TRINITY_DN1721_c0_g1_i1.p1  ORF type:complete len:742 (-),score=221.49 TRINITY_DN1721_c0_g1_i1:96-2321(-)